MNLFWSDNFWCVDIEIGLIGKVGWSGGVVREVRVMVSVGVGGF